MEKYWSKRAREIAPYVAGEQPKDKTIIKLNTNENPYPPSPKAIAALRETDDSAMRLYPDPTSTALCDVIARRHGVSTDMVFVGNGSDDVLAAAFMAFFDDELTMPEITYSFYPVWADLFCIDLQKIEMGDDMTISTEKLYGAKNVVIANPNAPTSIALSLDALAKIAETASGTVIVDEAYQEFGAESAIPLIISHENVVVVRTLSKSHSLAGMRVGYAIARVGMVEAMNRIRDSYNSYPVDAVAQRTATAALLDEGYTAEVIEKIVTTREKTANALVEMGFVVLPSSANFLFICHEEYSAEAIMDELREAGIVVRRFSAKKIANYLRVTIGTEAQMETFVSRIKEIITN